jgi:ribosomal protein S18 acetylase RimI-like enzyme
MILPSRKFENSGHIRKLDLSSDLDQVADLIEACFPISHDPDGQTYIREMRKTARDMRMLGWLSNLAELGSTKSAGFVWVEADKILGNLSLIPFQKDGRRFHLIANVAVTANQRRKGIARALTEHALAYLRRRGDEATWLQVRVDNPAAIALYRSAGFKNEAVRTTWRIRPQDFIRNAGQAGNALTVKQCNQQRWQSHQAWLADAYPSEIRWNLPVDFNRFAPGLVQHLTNFMDGMRFRHWAFYQNQELRGVITWQKTRAYADTLWLAFSPEFENEILPRALAYVLKRLKPKHPLSIDYPYGRFSQTFEDLGFTIFRTLIWMKCELA